jgi:hypothetical protein
MRRKKEEPKKDEVESTYYEDISYVCPKRGKVTERVKVKRLKTQKAPDKTSAYELEILKTESSDELS